MASMPQINFKIGIEAPTEAETKAVMDALMHGPLAFQNDKCRTRTKRASRQGREATRIRLFREEEVPVLAASLMDTDDVTTCGEEVTESFGRLPMTETAALEKINALLPNGAAKLTADEVYIHWAEAANTNFIPDRFAFMHRSTLQNIAKAADKGFAFMNSHRTGGMSTETELPFGKTFAGRYERVKDDETGEARGRALVGFYLLKDTSPNGSAGPSSDDLHRMIAGGVLGDVSVGLYGGTRLCDVCGEDLFAYNEETWEDLCPHVPGSTRKMGDEQIETQKKRGVPKGACSYSIVDADCGELSGVYDGAVPGAGFKFSQLASRDNRYAPLFAGTVAGAGLAKARRMAKNEAEFDKKALDECLAAYPGEHFTGAKITSPKTAQEYRIARCGCGSTIYTHSQTTLCPDCGKACNSEVTAPLLSTPDGYVTTSPRLVPPPHLQEATTSMTIRADGTWEYYQPYTVDTVTTTDSFGTPADHSAGFSFGEQVDRALAALNACLERAEQVQALRSADGRKLSTERIRQLEQAQERLFDLLDSTATAPEPKSSDATNAARIKLQGQALTLRGDVARLLAGK